MLYPEEIVLRLTLATILGGLIGLERGRLERAAGLRTHALVAMGSCLVMLVSSFGFQSVVAAPAVVVDPSRVAAQVVSGIGFLGAGTIILRREIVRGLTTAASIWSVAAIGLAVGGGLYLAAVVATVLGLLILAGLMPVERLLHHHRRERILTLIVDRRKFSLYEIETVIEQDGLHLQQLLIQPSSEDNIDRVSLEFNGQGTAVATVLDQMRRLPGVVSIETTSRVPQARMLKAALEDVDA